MPWSLCPVVLNLTEQKNDNQAIEVKVIINIYIYKQIYIHKIKPLGFEIHLFQGDSLCDGSLSCDSSRLILCSTTIPLNIYFYKVYDAVSHDPSSPNHSDDLLGLLVLEEVYEPNFPRIEMPLQECKKKTFIYPPCLFFSCSSTSFHFGSLSLSEI